MKSKEDEIAKSAGLRRPKSGESLYHQRAQSRRKRLERMEVMSKPLGDEKSANFHFDITKQSGNEVLRVHDLTISYENQCMLLTEVSFMLTRGESAKACRP